MSDPHSTRRCLLEVEFLQITAFIHPFKSETERNETCGNLRRRGLELTLVVGWARTQQQQTVVGTAVVSRCSVKSNGQELLLQYKTIRERRSPFQEDADGDGGRPLNVQQARALKSTNSWDFLSCCRNGLGGERGRKMVVYESRSAITESVLTHSLAFRKNEPRNVG